LSPGGIYFLTFLNILFVGASGDGHGGTLRPLHNKCHLLRVLENILRMVKENEKSLNEKISLNYRIKIVRKKPKNIYKQVDYYYIYYKSAESDVFSNHQIQGKFTA